MEDSVTFRIKVQGGGGGEHTVAVSKNAVGGDLLREVRRVVGVASDAVDVKVLLGGKRITDDVAVASLRNSSPLLVMGVASSASPKSSPVSSPLKNIALPLRTSLSVDEARRQNARDHELEVEAAKLDKLSEAALAFSREQGHDGEYFAELQDQNGRVVKMPESDKQNMIAAQVLHEHGKRLMSQDKFEDAVRVLKDAVNLFQKVSPALLKIIDNYGLCALDCAWCYLKIGDVGFLPTAREHLISAKFALELAHGPNLERLMQVKGDEYILQRTLYVRLALLQGVVCWHRGEHVSAQSYLSYAEDLARTLRVEDAEIEPLILMGFNKAEARRGLRLANKDAEQAVQVIMTRREQLKQQARDRKRQRQQERMGKTVSGNYVDLEMFDELVSMGFDAKSSASALRQSDNDFARATEILTTNPELLDSDGGVNARRTKALNELAAMGFSNPELAERALNACGGNVEEAANMMLGGSAERALDDVRHVEQEAVSENVVPAREFEDDGFLAPMNIEDDEQRLKREREAEIHEAARADLINALQREDGYDHDQEFDLNLDDEIALIEQHKLMMLHAGRWKI